MSQTHELVVTSGELVKRYTSWDRGEHRREWTVLNHLWPHFPELVPRPVRADLDTDPPFVVMTVAPGTPLGKAPLTGAQLDALEDALRQMWSVPVTGLPPRRYHLREAVDAATGWYAGATRPNGVAGEAFDAAVAFLREPPLPEVSDDQAVLGHSDPNLANYLWDGERVRIVDFEDAGRSDVAYELATLVEHLSARDADWEEFVTRFGVDAERLRRARCLSKLLWLHMLLPGHGAAKRNPPGTLEQQAKRLLLLTA